MNYGLLLLLVLLGLLGLGLAYLALTPPHLAALAARPRPAADYAEAVARLAAVQAQDTTAAVNPKCHTRFFSPGHKTDRVIVFIHGYTNCPQQFAQLGGEFYERGDTVLIARMPHHGLTDRLTKDLTHFTAEEMTAYGDQIVDVAAGLGDHLTVVGLSGGGVIAGWLAQQRPEVDRAVLIAPGFGLLAVPAPATQLVTNLALRLPDAFPWWDPRTGDPGPKSPMAHSYPRFSLHGLAQQLRLGLAVRALARRAAPAAGAILLVTVGSDFSVDNAAAARVAADWRAHGAEVVSYEFPAEWRIEHDLIDPGQPKQQVGRVYAKLIELIAR